MLPEDRRLSAQPACHAAGSAVVPQGGNTGLVGGSVPDNTGTQVVLQLGRMSRLRALDPDNQTVTVARS